jgi:hypothetical protein
VVVVAGCVLVVVFAVVVVVRATLVDVVELVVVVGGGTVVVVVAVVVVVVAGGPTCTVAMSWLFCSLLSAMRFTSSTQAVSVCDPAVAVQVLFPRGPLLAVAVTDWPGASEDVRSSDHDTSFNPSMKNPTPWTTPEGVGAVPMFRMTALNVTSFPG